LGQTTVVTGTRQVFDEVAALDEVAQIDPRKILKIPGTEPRNPKLPGSAESRCGADVDAPPAESEPATPIASVVSPERAKPTI
jgi:hypothetical protein